MKFIKTTILVLGFLLILGIINRTIADIRTKALQSIRPALETTDKILKKAASLKPGRIKLSTEQKLKTDIKILEARLAQMEEISMENERLKLLLDFRKRITYETIPAEVIGRDPSNWTNIIFIDKGSEHGIESRAGVATGEGLAGKIIDVGETVSKVMLINDPDSRIAAVVQRSRQEGVVCGTLSRRCRMIYISPDADVKVGDAVVTMGGSKKLPKGILIGKIVDLFEDKGGLYRSAIIRPSADLGRIEEVLCIK